MVQISGWKQENTIFRFPECSRTIWKVNHIIRNAEAENENDNPIDYKGSTGCSKSKTEMKVVKKVLTTIVIRFLICFTPCTRVFPTKMVNALRCFQEGVICQRKFAVFLPRLYTSYCQLLKVWMSYFSEAKQASSFFPLPTFMIRSRKWLSSKGCWSS